MSVGASPPARHSLRCDSQLLKDVYGETPASSTDPEPRAADVNLAAILYVILRWSRAHTLQRLRSVLFHVIPRRRRRLRGSRHHCNSSPQLQGIDNVASLLSSVGTGRCRRYQRCQESAGDALPESECEPWPQQKREPLKEGVEQWKDLGRPILLVTAS